MYGQDVPSYENEVSMSTTSKVIAQTDRHTDAQIRRQTHLNRHYENITFTAYAGGKNRIWFLYLDQLSSVQAF